MYLIILKGLYIHIYYILFVKIGFGETVDIAYEMAARDSLRQLFGLSDTILLPFNLELDNLCASNTKNLSVNEWSQKKLSLQSKDLELFQTKKASIN